MADVLSKGRMAIGFGSGSTPEEFSLFGLAETDDDERHTRFAESLRIILSAWRGQGTDAAASEPPRYFSVPPHHLLPVPAANLPHRSWIAANSLGSARIAGALNFNMLFSHLRTPDQYRQYVTAYRSSGGSGLIAANRPVFVGPDDERAYALAEPALRILWRRFRQEGKIPAASPEPEHPSDLWHTQSISWSAVPSQSRDSSQSSTTRYLSMSPTSKCAGPAWLTSSFLTAFAA